ncbi:MAG: four helix bundle protein [Prolixibacteraceae bacterium]|nr:four helix bundle protein [Prolixibacteraceae bacterium]
MSFVKGFSELETYKLAREISFEIYRLSRLFPLEERYSLIDQIRRSSRSVGAQIAESWGKRRYEKHFISKLTDADAELFETQHWISTALECGYLEKIIHDELLKKCNVLSKKINTMILKADKFCNIKSIE